MSNKVYSPTFPFCQSVRLKDPVEERKEGEEGEVGTAIRQADLVGLFTRCVRVSLDTGEVLGLVFLALFYGEFL